MERINTVHEVQEYLRRNDDYEDYEVEFALGNPINENDINVVALSDEGDAIIINPNDLENIYYLLPALYNWDEDFFHKLEEDYEIIYVSMNCHYNIWETINEWYPNDIEHITGMHKYIEYCKENNINKEVIDKVIGLNVIDVMQMLEKEEFEL